MAATDKDRNYLAALVQLSQQTVTIKVPGRTLTVPIQSINGVPLATQIEEARKAL